MFDPRGPSLVELAKQALSSTTKGYDLLAPKFEYTPFRTPDEVLEPLAEAIGPAKSIDRALDVCCGTGAAMRVLRPLCREYVTGIDLSRGMLEEAEKLLEDGPGDAEVRLECVDTFEMDYDEEFDVVTTCGSLGHILEHQQDLFAHRVWSALRPGGRFVFPTSEMPPVASRRWLVSRTFNAVMHLRNAVIKPPFIMFYLTFTEERAREVLGRKGFEIEVQRPYEGSDFSALRLMVATKPE